MVMYVTVRDRSRLAALRALSRVPPEDEFEIDDDIPNLESLGADPDHPQVKAS